MNASLLNPPSVKVSPLPPRSDQSNHCGVCLSIYLSLLSSICHLPYHLFILSSICFIIYLSSIHPSA